MKIKKIYTSLFRNLAKTAFIILLVILFFAGNQSGRQIQNPYQEVDWSNYIQYKANFNTHTMVSDGWENPQSVVENYRKHDYRILSITDPDVLTFPWEEFSNFKASDLTISRMKHLAVKPFEENSIFEKEIEFKNISSSEAGMVAIKGHKLLFEKHGVNSYFNDYTKTDENIFTSVLEKNGLMVMNHPGQNKLPLEWYSNLFRSYNHLVGIEVFNSVSNGRDVRILWDSIQTMVAPVRQVWGFANDNFLSLRDLGESWNVMIVNELSERKIRKALENGTFYMVHAPQGHNGPQPPVINSIQINSKRGIIDIEASGQDSIIWIANGIKVGNGSHFCIKKLPENSKYIRAELFGAGNSIVCTQPFLMK